MRNQHSIDTPKVTYMKVTKSQYTGSGSVGDFSWMIDRPEYARSLFIFNDNEMQFIAFHTGHEAGFTAGGGNAAITYSLSNNNDFVVLHSGDPINLETSNYFKYWFT